MAIKQEFMIPAPLLVGIELNPGPALTQEQRRKILFWKQDAGLSNSAIAKKLGIDRKTVQLWVKRGKKNLSLQNLRGQGRKRRFTVKQEERIAKKAKKKGKDAPEIAKEMSEKLGESVSPYTIQRVLQRQGLKYLVRLKREQITSSQAIKRLQFSKKRLNDDWKFALFTDEKTFQVGSTHQMAWQDPNDRETFDFQRHPKKIHVWGGIGLHFKTKLYFFDKILDASLFCKILKARLPPAYSYGLSPRDHDKWVLVQ